MFKVFGATKVHILEAPLNNWIDQGMPYDEEKDETIWS
jgi:3-mercaptopyruvate sulfurtransferase SseA